jgi:hypothetical protein
MRAAYEISLGQLLFVGGAVGFFMTEWVYFDSLVPISTICALVAVFGQVLVAISIQRYLCQNNRHLYEDKQLPWCYRLLCVRPSVALPMLGSLNDGSSRSKKSRWLRTGTRSQAMVEAARVLQVPISTRNTTKIKVVSYADTRLHGGDKLAVTTPKLSMDDRLSFEEQDLDGGRGIAFSL